MSLRFLAFLLLPVMLGGCYPSSDERFRMGEGEVSDLVVILKSDIDEFEAEEFVQKALTPGDGSRALPKGVQAIMKMKIEERDVQVINFFPDATSSQRADLEQVLLQSPFVDHVFQEMTPEQAVEELSNMRNTS